MSNGAEMKQICILLLLLFTSTGTVFEQISADRNINNIVPPRNLAKQESVQWAKKVQQGFNMKVWMNNQTVLGFEALDLPIGIPPPEDCRGRIGLLYPADSCVEHLFAAAPVIAAKVNGVRRVTQGYNTEDARMEFVPNRNDTARDRIWRTSINSLDEPNKRGIDDDNDGKIDEDELDGFDNDGDWVAVADDVGADRLPDSLEIGCKGSFDPITNPDPAFDNYEPMKTDSCHPDYIGNYPLKDNRDRYTEKNRLPDHGEPHVDEDYAAISDMDLSFGVTDTVVAFSLARHIPMGVKVFQKSYAWNRGLLVDAIVILDYSFINIGRNILNDVYLGMFADIDIVLENVTDQTGGLAAYDPATRTAYKYPENSTRLTPLGITLLATTRPLDSLALIFQWYSPGEIGIQDSFLYSWISGKAFGGQLIKHDQTNPYMGSRVLFSFGPFGRMNPGDSDRVVFALVSGATVADMLNNARLAKSMYENGYFVGYVDHHQSPIKFSLAQNYPNPFNAQTVIRYELPVASSIRLSVYNILGEKITTLIDAVQEPGYKSVERDASNVASGVYFYEFRIGNYRVFKKMLLMR
jgi:hypothetical protein